MSSFAIVVGVLQIVIMVVVFALVTIHGRSTTQRSDVCPKCGKGDVTIITSGKSTFLESDEDPPRVTTLHYCKDCGEKLKWEQHAKRWTTPDQAELERFPCPPELDRMRSAQATVFGVVTIIGAFCAGAYFAYRVGCLCYLVSIYGVRAIWTETLYIVSTPRGRPWIVSNGDQLPDANWFMFLAWTPLLIGYFFLIAALISRYSPWKLERKRSDSPMSKQTDDE